MPNIKNTAYLSGIFDKVNYLIRILDQPGFFQCDESAVFLDSFDTFSGKQKSD